MTTLTINRDPRRIIFGGFHAAAEVELDLCVDLGADMIVYGLDDEDDDKRGVDRADYEDEWTRRRAWRGDRLERAIDAARAKGLAVGVHYWGRPDIGWTQGAAEDIQAVHRDHPIDWVYHDSERHDIRMRAEQGGFADCNGDGDYEDDYVAWLAALWACPPGHDPALWPSLGAAVYGLPNARSKQLAHIVDQLVLMIYFNAKHTGEVGAAVRLARRCLAKWEGHRQDAQIVMGFGAYDQGRPGVSPQLAMEAAHDAMRRAGVTHDAYWSLPWIAKSHAAQRAIRRLWGGQ
jgi:hypothetical protein